MFNLGQILQDAEIGLEVLTELALDTTELKAGQPVTQALPGTMSIDGVSGCTISVTVTPPSAALKVEEPESQSEAPEAPEATEEHDDGPPSA